MAVPVSDAVADALLEKLVPKINALKIGPTSESDSDLGPLVTAQHQDRVSGYVDAGEAEGATVVVNGRNYRQDKQGFKNGCYLAGTLLDNVTPEMSVWKDEIFGEHSMHGMEGVRFYTRIKILYTHQDHYDSLA